MLVVYVIVSDLLKETINPHFPILNRKGSANFNTKLINIGVLRNQCIESIDIKWKGVNIVHSSL